VLLRPELFYRLEARRILISAISMDPIKDTPPTAADPNLLHVEAVDDPAKLQRDNARTIEEFFAEPHGKENYKYLVDLAAVRLWRTAQTKQRVQDAADLVNGVLGRYLPSQDGGPPASKLPSNVPVVAVLLVAIRHAVFRSMGFVRRLGTDGRRHYRASPDIPTEFVDLKEAEETLASLAEPQDAFMVELGKTYPEFRDSIPDFRVRELMDAALDYNFEKSAVLARALSTTSPEIELRKKRLRRYVWQAVKEFNEYYENEA
jgi:hypothetical protein